MKKLFLFVLVLSTSIVFSQKKHPQEPNFTTEQKAQLIVKKMTNGLDLETNQANKIKPIIIAKINKMDALKKQHKATKKPLSSDERFKLAMNRLDDEAQLHQQMKKILNKQQYQTWILMHAKHNRHQKGVRAKKRKHNKHTS